ncbi:MAG TPA: hypothetical protein VFE21_11950 [Rubrobacteraceae bacterium]|nr:hypothetical protein [Rubrobacteraceae bacterium]
MERADRELNLEEIPRPPLFKLADEAGQDVFDRKEVGGEPSTVGALFASRELAEEFSANAAEFGLEAMANLEVRELPDWGSIEVYAAAGEEYILVVSEKGTGLFFAGDVARHAALKNESLPFPLYIFSDERGEAPLISVEDEDGVLLVAALFSSPAKAHEFRERAAHLGLPDHLGTIEDTDGLSRHVRVARQAGADYAVVDPESGTTEAIPLEDLIS